MPSFEYTPQNLDRLEIAISQERIARYVELARGDRASAVRLYEINTSICEALHGVIQGLEVPLRNSVHLILSTDLGADWVHTAGFHYPLGSMVAECDKQIVKQGKAITPARTIAGLPLGFWTLLFSSKYEKSFWVPHLHRAFPFSRENTVGKMVSVSRRDISERLEKMRSLRNRIAHHEQVIELDLESAFSELLETINWICPVTSKWVGCTNRFRECLLRLHEHSGKRRRGRNTAPGERKVN